MGLVCHVVRLSFHFVVGSSRSDLYEALHVAQPTFAGNKDTRSRKRMTTDAATLMIHEWSTRAMPESIYPSFGSRTVFRHYYAALIGKSHDGNLCQEWRSRPSVLTVNHYCISPKRMTSKLEALAAKVS
jgi:hypothetical protein